MIMRLPTVTLRAVQMAGGRGGGGISHANFRCFANLVMSRVAYAKEDRFPLATGFASKAWHSVIKCLSYAYWRRNFKDRQIIIYENILYKNIYMNVYQEYSVQVGKTAVSSLQCSCRV